MTYDIIAARHRGARGEREREREREGETDRQTDRQADRWRQRQTDDPVFLLELAFKTKIYLSSRKSVTKMVLVIRPDDSF